MSFIYNLFILLTWFLELINLKVCVFSVGICNMHPDLCYFIKNLLFDLDQWRKCCQHLEKINAFMCSCLVHPSTDYLLLRPLIILSEISESFPTVFHIPDVYILSICCRLPSKKLRVDCFYVASV